MWLSISSSIRWLIWRLSSSALRINKETSNFLSENLSGQLFFSSCSFLILSEHCELGSDSTFSRTSRPPTLTPPCYHIPFHCMLSRFRKLLSLHFLSFCWRLACFLLLSGQWASLVIVETNSFSLWLYWITASAAVLHVENDEIYYYSECFL